MRIFTLFITFLTTSYSYSQMRPIDKVYIVEGVVADRETLKAVSSAILYNDSLGITTTSDENGYFKIVVPYELLKNRISIPMTVVKTGYKRNGSGLSYNPDKPDTTNDNDFESVIWNYDVKIFWMAKDQSNLSSTVSAHAPAKAGSHGYLMIRQTFDEAVASERWSRELEELKKGNEKVYFTINGHVCLVTSSYDMYFDESAPIVFIDDKRVKLAEINKMVKRSEVAVDDAKSQTLSKRYGKDVIALKVKNKSLGARL
jgi:hypothetical protein